MSQPVVETINTPGMDIQVRRENTRETYLALEPPGALPYVVAPREADINEVVAFVVERLEVLRELQAEMQKHFKKTNSLKCRYKTGDVVCLLSRPFMLRSNPLSTSQKGKVGARGRASVRASMRTDLSVIDLFVVQAGNYDQGRQAFLGLAKPIFARNVLSLIEQCMAIVYPEASLPQNVRFRPMRDSWVRIDAERDTVWFSESLIPYPANTVVYAYLAEAVKHYSPDADAEQQQALLARGVPNWQQMKDLLTERPDRFAM